MYSIIVIRRTSVIINLRGERKRDEYYTIYEYYFTSVRVYYVRNNRRRGRWRRTGSFNDFNGEKVGFTESLRSRQATVVN